MKNENHVNRLRSNLLLWSFGLFMLTSTLSLHAQCNRKTINSGWTFKMSADANWTRINLPHTFNLDAYRQREYYRGKAVYRKSFALSELPQGKRFFLKVDAASKSADVMLNGRLLGTHAGGYSAFVMDITEALQAENRLEITVDNERNDITPIWADFTFWGGIYRDVWLMATPEQHFDKLNMGSEGIFVCTPVVNEQEATVCVKGNVTNDAQANATVEIVYQLIGPKSDVLQCKTENVRLKAGETRSFSFQSAKVMQPQLWSPESPTLYRVVTTIRNPKTKEVLEENTQKVGFRWFRFDGKEGFFLNGKPYKLRGVNRHQDQAPVGVALDDEAHRRDISLMKEIGCNFIRISHYPQDDALLEACDEQGLLAWEEIPIIDMVPDTPGYDDHCEANLREMIRQHYNHPSVIAWGYMNEILLIAPKPDQPEWPACKERTVRLAKRLERVLKEEDASRVSVMAFNMTNLYNEIGLDLEDVAGWNLYHGWYVGELHQFNEWMDDQHRRYPNHPTIISEWGAGSDRRLHASRPHAFDFSIEYQQTYIEHYLPFIEQTDYISGCAYWNFIDFNVAARQESMPRVNNKGIFYNDRSPKDVAFYFKAMWRTDVPVVHIACRDRMSFTKCCGGRSDLESGLANDVQRIKVYSNLAEIELFVNGQSAGIQKVNNCFALFDVKLPVGRSLLLAKGTTESGSSCKSLNGQSAEDAWMVTLNEEPSLEKGEELAINVGSNCAYTSSVSQLTWLPDRPYQPGSWGYVDGKERSTTSEIVNTEDGPIYQTWREGLSAYLVDAPEGAYEIEVLMADVSRPKQQLANLLGKENTSTTEGGTRFALWINDQKVEADLSPACGDFYQSAFRRRYLVHNHDRQLKISFEPIQGKCLLSGLKIRKR